ncbi:MAG: hypothetical protein JXB00_12540 [Bacteroidales bacterium]|nr:hypothetical protein [Bacteroidales bacterium]
MKKKGLIIISIIFFLLVNTSYYWEGKLGLFTYPFFLLLVIIYLVLGIALIRQFYLSIKEKFGNKNRLLTIGFLLSVLIIIFFKPHGLINFDKLEGDDLLVAEREGAANCMITLKLKDDYTFKERRVCFGVTENTGEYHIQNDTIYFDNVNIGRHTDDYYDFGVVKPSKLNKDGKHFNMVRYKSLTDTLGQELFITKMSWVN